MMHKKCAICGLDFYPNCNRQITCSVECSAVNKRNLSKKQRKDRYQHKKADHKICIYCGKEFSPMHGGRKTCSDECKAAHSRELKKQIDRKHSEAMKKPVVEKICKGCGKTFITNLPYKVYCKGSCTSKTNHKATVQRRTEVSKAARSNIPCRICGAIFFPKTKTTYCCSLKCSEENEKRLNSQWRAACYVPKKTKPTKRICKWCGVEFEAIGKRSYCCPEHMYAGIWGRLPAIAHTKQCQSCGCEFISRKSKQKYCSIKCANKEHARVDHSRRRAFRNGVQHEPYSRRMIFERDNFTCHICGKSLDMDAVAPAYDSPTVDHVIPLAGGGRDTVDNVKAAHFICNSTKSHRNVSSLIPIRMPGGRIKFVDSETSSAMAIRVKKNPNVENPANACQ